MSKLFRKEAVDGYKDQFLTDKHIGKLSFSSAVFSIIFIVGLICVLVWFFKGNIVETAETVGVIYPAGGIEKIYTANSGNVSEINFTVGDEVEPGDVIAIIPDYNILEKINNAVVSGISDAELEKLRQDYYTSSVLKAKSAGIVISAAGKGDYLNSGDAAAMIAVKRADSNQREILAFLPASEKNNISRGCKVQVSPNYAKREKYGFINGYVSDIGNNFITRTDAEKMYNAYNIPNLLDENKTYFSVSIDLLADTSTASGLEWSSSAGGNIDVGIGTVCDCSIVISEQPPYKWLLGGGRR